MRVLSLTSFLYFCVCVAQRDQSVLNFATVGVLPLGIALNSNGDIYIVIQASSGITEITAAGIVNSSFLNFDNGQTPWDVAFDASDNMFITVQISASESVVQKYNFTSGALVDAEFGGVLPTGITNAIEIGIDGHTLYVYDQTGRIFSISSAGVLDNTAFVANISTGGGGMAFDVSGNLYFTSYYGNALFVVSPNGTVSTVVSLNGPTDVIVDCHNNIFVSLNGNAAFSIVRVMPNGAVQTYVDPSFGLNNPVGLALDSSGNLYVSNKRVDGVTPGFVSKITPLLGWFRSKEFRIHALVA
jgi:serine/threonine-protein kinase